MDEQTADAIVLGYVKADILHLWDEMTENLPHLSREAKLEIAHAGVLAGNGPHWWADIKRVIDEERPV